ncbi:Aldo/keto reductase [Peniophora sp. CONT]|nr:Aldo/keto reductase [Peniophora sp. CONT]
MVDVPHATLNTGAKIPLVGLGCWMGEFGGEERAYEMCKKAIAAGYRHIDTAAGYGNEESVGKAILDSGIPRSSFFITTKLHNIHHSQVSSALTTSLSSLGTSYVDLYLMHWPQAALESEWPGKALQPDEHPTFNETWSDMEKEFLDGDGRVKAIGISNFSVGNLERLEGSWRVVPAVNQVEMHPFLPQVDVKEWCEKRGIHLTAYSPIGQPNEGSSAPSLLKNELIVKLAEKYGVTTGQILLSWGVQRGTSVIPKSENPDRLRKNIAVVKFDETDMKAIDELHTQPGLHRSLLGHVPGYHSDGGVFGWTHEQLGWPFDSEGVVVKS